MFSLINFATAGTIAALIGLNGGTVPKEASPAKYNNPVRCEIEASSSRGMTMLQGVVYSNRKTSGTYRFSLTGKGRRGGTNIQQGGEFFVDRGGHSALGVISLGGRASDYNVRLKLRVNGKTITCGANGVTNI